MPSHGIPEKECRLTVHNYHVELLVLYVVLVTETVNEPRKRVSEVNLSSGVVEADLGAALNVIAPVYLDVQRLRLSMHLDMLLIVTKTTASRECMA